MVGGDGGVCGGVTSEGGEEEAEEWEHREVLRGHWTKCTQLLFGWK